MSKIIALLRRDYDNVRHNVIALLVCVGLVIMPSLYAWFNIAGGWDPYANTGQLKVALANSDEGVRGGIVAYRINVGERVVSTLAESTAIGYEIVTEDEAIDGVSSGEFYAAVVIPKDFSSKLLSVLTSNPSHPQLDYYVNEKRNPIASIVTGKASGSVQTMVDEGFTKAVSEVATELMGEISSLVEDDSMLTVGASFDGAVSESLRSLRRTADGIDAYRGVVASIRGVTEAASAALGTESPSIDAAHMLGEAADGVRDFGTAAQTAKDGASSAIDTGANSLQDVEDAIGAALDVADGQTDKLIEALGKVGEAAAARRDDLQTLYDALEKLDGDVAEFSQGIEDTVGETEVNIQYAHTVTTDISGVLTRLKNTIGYLDDIIATGDRTVTDLQNSKTDVGTSRDELVGLVAQARDDFDAARESYDDNLSGSLDQLADSIDEAAAEASGASATIRDKVGKIAPAVDGASRDLKKLEDSLDAIAKKLDAAAQKLEDLHDKLSEALTSGNLDAVRGIFAADPAALVDFFTAPVELDREALYSVENNGSAMTPFYTTMALWVGGTLMGILFYASVSKRALGQTGASPRHAYFARLAFFLTIGACQATMLLLGDLFFLRIQCDNPILFMLTGWLASTVFINIIFALSSAFGDVGKAIGLLFMVVQVAGSGGTFPVEMLPKLFQTLYSYLPFVYSENAMREAICGVYGDHWLVAMGTLALYLIPALLLGLVLSKPFVPINEWIEEHLEETKFM